jgi:hypothetical protein
MFDWILRKLSDLLGGEGIDLAGGPHATTQEFTNPLWTRENDVDGSGARE